MTWLKEVALPALGKGWKHLAEFAKAIREKVGVWLDAICDPPPRTRRFYFWSVAALILTCWLTFAFVNSWFYRPTVEALMSFSWGGDDLDVVLPEHVEVAAPPAPAAPLVVCQDMSDTPHCAEVPSVKLEPVVVEALPLPVQKPSLKKKKKITPSSRKHQPYQTVWGF